MQLTGIGGITDDPVNGLGDWYFISDVFVQDNLTVNGNATFKQDVEICGDLTVKGNITDENGNIIIDVTSTNVEITGQTPGDNVEIDDGSIKINDTNGDATIDKTADGLEVEATDQSSGNSASIIIDAANSSICAGGTFKVIGVIPVPGQQSEITDLLYRQKKDSDFFMFFITPSGGGINAYNNASGNTTGFDFNASTNNISLTPGTSLGLNGDFTMNGTANISGTLNVFGFKNFKIDHPLDPLNKYLIHSCIEGPEALNIYNGNIKTDEHGLNTVQLPGYFNALNRDYRYQLTIVGKTFAKALIWEEVNDKNEFVIKTDEPGIDVSWQVTGVRDDAYARDNMIKVEPDKETEMIGKLLYQP